MSVDELIEATEQLRDVEYDSPKVMLWKKKAKETILTQYGKEYLEMFDRVFVVRRISRSRAESNQMFQERIARVVELLKELVNEPMKEEPKVVSSIKTDSGDSIKDAIINWLYSAQKDNPSRQIGWHKYEIVREVSYQDFDESDVNFAFDFLEDEGYFKSTSQSKVKYYRLSSKAHKMIMPPSQYAKVKKGEGSARITNEGGVIVFGDNYGDIRVDARTEIIEKLEKIEAQILENDGIDDVSKLDVVGSSGTIKSQLRRKSPDFSIISSAWAAVEEGTQFGELSDSIKEVGLHLDALLGA